MFPPQVKGSALVLVLGLAAGVVCIWPPEPPRSPAAEPTRSKLMELRQERLAALKGIAAHAAQAYGNGMMSADQVHEADMAVLDAELDLCASDKRVALLEKIVGLARKREEVAVEASKSHIVPTNTALRAKVRRLDAEIALERARGD